MGKAHDEPQERRLGAALPGVHMIAFGTPTAILLAGATVAVLLEDGRTVAGTVVIDEVDDPRVSIRPWGCAGLHELDLVDVAACAIVSARFDVVQRIGIEQRREWR